MATWAKGVDFKNSNNTSRIGGIGIYGTDSTINKLYIGLGAEPWNNAGLQLTSSAINFKGNKIYHAGDKPTLSELGAAAASHTHSYIPLSGSTGVTGTLRSNSEIQTTSQNAFRAVSGNYGFFIRNDGSNTYFMLTNSGDQYGNWNSLRPIMINNSTGLVTLGNGASGNLTGNASTATKLQNAKTIALSGDASGSASFDGSANATINATVRKTCLVGSDTDDTSGWYKVASQTMSGYGDANITFAITSTYGYYNSGILQLQIRSENTFISCKRLAWHSRMGLSTSHYIININGMTWTLYAYQPNNRYGRLMFEVLSQSSINNKNSGFTLYNTSTKESTVPTATVTSSDGATVGTANTLTTARTFTIGKTGKSFNGAANVSWSTDEIGALDKNNDSTLASGKKILLGYSSSWLNGDSSNGAATLRAGGNLFLHGDADASSTSEFVSIKAGNNDLRVISSAASTGQDKLTFNGNIVYHAGRKPTVSEIGAAASNHNHNGIYVNDKANVSGNMNNAAGYRNALGMINLSGTDATINPNGQTGWHHFINMSY